MNYRLIIALLFLAPGWSLAGTAQVASQIKGEYESAMQRWAMKMQTAVGDAAREVAAGQKPDATEYWGRMWTELQPSLRSEWTLEFIPWLMNVAPQKMVDTKGGTLKRSPLQEVMREVELMHLTSPKVGPFCVAMTTFPDPVSLSLVEKIEQKNPNVEVQGQAAIAQAILLRGLGDGREVLLKRRAAVRRAIIKAANVKVGDTTVGDLAMDETHIMRWLMRGKEAPNVTGRDIAGLPLDLKSYRGKIVVLAFWNAGSPTAQQTIDLLTKLHNQSLGRPVELLGVSTNSAEVLRKLKADGVLPWRNFADADGKITHEYRIKKVPSVYVLDKKGVIQFIGVPGSFVELAVDDLVKQG
jgi:peroxiredoxin